MGGGETSVGEVEKPESLRCDFCGEVATSVRRIALDQDYDRLLKPHREQYACARCSEQKERSRRGM
jgi:hypothetical protein